MDGAQIKKYESHRVSTNLNVAVLGTRKGLGCACSEILDLGSVDFHRWIVFSATLMTCAPTMYRGHQRSRAEQ